MSREEVILGVDPGRSKTGLALVKSTGEIVKTQVALMTDFAGELQNFLDGAAIQRVVLGNGTTSQNMVATLQQLLPGVACQVVEESHSTEEARKLYWQLYPPKGLKKLIPRGLQVPPENLDGLAAVILVRRFLQPQNI